MRRLTAAGLAAIALAGCGADREERPDRAAGDGGVLQDTPPATRPAEPADVMEPVRRTGAVIERRTQLRRSPGGRVVATVGRRTAFDGRQVLAVVARKGDWLGVLHASHARGRKAAWIPAAAARTLRRRYEIIVDRSKLRASLFRDGKFVTRFVVGAGRAGNATPLGRYAITDRLRTGNPASPYGCCILALTGRQPSLPQGWAGGDRIAFHGGPAWRVGVRVTSGCMTVGDRALRRVFGQVTAGTRVTIKA